MPPKVSVLVLNYNGRPFLRDCLDSLRDQDYPDFEVVLIDNGSADNSIPYLEEAYPWVKVMAMGENLGFARAYNRAIAQIDSELVAVLNNDTRVDRRWLTELVAGLNSQGDVAACTSKLLFMDRPDTLNHAGGALTLAGGGHDIGFGEVDDATYNRKRYVGAFSGAASLLRRQAFLAAGGFDDDYFAYFEDTDLSWRLWLYGYKILYVPTAVVYHKYGGSGGGWTSPFRLYHAQRNRVASVIKNFQVRNVLRGLAVSLVFDLARSWFYLRRGNLRATLAIWRGNLMVTPRLLRLLGKRKSIQRQRKVSDRELEDMGLFMRLGESLSAYRRLTANLSP